MDDSSQNQMLPEKDPTLLSTSSPTSQMPPSNNKKKTTIIAVVVALLLIAAAIAVYMFVPKPEPQPTAASIKVGVMLPFSGGASGSGFGELKGIELAKKELGATNIELIQADSKCDGEAALPAIKELIAKGVSAIIGEACSGASLAALPEADKNKVVMVSPSASSPSLSKPDDYFFRVVPPDELQGKFTAETMYAKGIKTAALLHTDEPYGNALAAVFKENYEKLGGKVVSTGKFGSEEINLTTQISALKAANPEGIYLISNATPPVIAALKGVRAAGVTAPFYGADSIYDGLIINESGTASEGLVITTFPGGTKAFKQSLANAYPSEEQTYGAAEAYDAFHAIYKATLTGASTGEQIKAELMKLDFEGVTGHIKFDANGEISDTYTYDLLIVKDGDFAPVEEE